MRPSLRIAVLLLAVSMLLPIFFACKREGVSSNISSEQVTEELPEETFSAEMAKGTSTAPEAGAKIYNVIFTLATLPPVLAALDAISNGGESYAIIERGKTYNGIESVESFHNVGFDTESNESRGFTDAEFDAMTEQVRSLRASEENSFFYFYAQDGTAMHCAAMAANAGIPLEDFHVVMCEDGTGTYRALYDTFISGKSVTESEDAPYEAFMQVLNEAGTAFTEIMLSRDNENGDEALKYDIPRAFALSVLPNFTYWLQNEAGVESILGEAEGSELLCIFGMGEGESGLNASLRYQTISEKIYTLNENMKADYLALMYGDYYKDTYNVLTRTTRSGEVAPAEKLVFIGTLCGDYPKFASEAKYGIGGIEKGGAIPQSYSELDEKYKNELLFSCEDDYRIFLDCVNDPDNYPYYYTGEVIAEIKRACFNLYVDYIYTLKYAYLLYGEEYDLIIKGHPRESVGDHSEWGNRYKIDWAKLHDGRPFVMYYYYDMLLDDLLMSFHTNDSVGRCIGMVPYGTAAENLAYLGVDITVCGLPSSTYSGLDTGVDVLFIMCDTDESICGDDSQVKDRFNAGELTYTEDGSTLPTIYYNTGNTYKYAAQIFESSGDRAKADEYRQLFRAWLAANRPGADDIDAQGLGK